MATPTTRLFPLLFLLSLCFAGGTVRSDEDCVFTMYVRTASLINAGTDSIIGLNLYDANGYSINVTNLEEWGLMDPGHNYFERGNLDIFSGKAPCLKGPVCAINLTSDESGDHHGWLCNYVEVTSTGVHILPAQQLFTVDQWLAKDRSPYELWAARNNCNYDLGQVSPKTKAIDAIGSGSGSGSDFSILGSTIRA